MLRYRVALSRYNIFKLILPKLQPLLRSKTVEGEAKRKEKRTIFCQA